MPKTKISLIYPELGYKIIGILYDVCNRLGSGYQEKYYQKALAVEFNKLKLGILANFTSEGVKYKRILNIY